MTGLKVPASISRWHDSCGFAKGLGFPHGSQTHLRIERTLLHQLVHYASYAYILQGADILCQVYYHISRHLPGESCPAFLGL